MKVIYRKSIEDQICDVIIQAGTTEAFEKIILTPYEWKRMVEENPKILGENDFVQYIPKLKTGWWKIAGVPVTCPADAV